VFDEFGKYAHWVYNDIDRSVEEENSKISSMWKRVVIDNLGI
jgi:hypothetical protein